MRSPSLLATATILAFVTGAACDSPTTPSEGTTAAEQTIAIQAVVGEQLARLPSNVQRDIAALRAATSPLHNLDRAIAAGFAVDLTGCLENPPIGGMGHHYAMLSRIDGAPPVVTEPEILVFSPKRNGKLQLGAVEYIIPYAAWLPAQPPELLGQTFHRNDGAGLWVLHVWLWNHNPDGLFADWNPTVSCP